MTTTMNKRGLGLAFGLSLILWALIITAGMAVMGCSADCSKVDCKTPAAAAEPTDETPDHFDLKGSIVSAFAVTVDGVKYDDMEDYYTQTVNGLDTKVQQLGYRGYTAELQAELGYSDLSNGMAVYVTPSTDRGYQGKTWVKNDGTFSLTLPGDGLGDSYQVKGTKRIRLTLTKGSDVKRFCFNFSAVDLEVPYEAKDKPVVLKTFKSTITAYACLVDPKLEGDLPIPEAPDADESLPVNPPQDKVDADILAAAQAAKAKEIEQDGN